MITEVYSVDHWVRKQQLSSKKVINGGAIGIIESISELPHENARGHSSNTVAPIELKLPEIQSPRSHYTQHIKLTYTCQARCPHARIFIEIWESWCWPRRLFLECLRWYMRKSLSKSNSVDLVTQSVVKRWCAVAENACRDAKPVRGWPINGGKRKRWRDGFSLERGV